MVVYDRAWWVPSKNTPDNKASQAMRLSAELIASAEQRSNPLGEREIVLRGLAIPAIENLATTRDLFDAIDLADNMICRLDNFPRLVRLSSLFLSGNMIESIDANIISKNLPNLTNLVLTGNRISGLNEISNISKACSKLQFLTLCGNPVTKRQHYRLYTIHKIPSLKVLDFIKVKDEERERAMRLAKSAVGAALEGDVQAEAREAATKTFTPGEGQSTKTAFTINFTQEQKLMIKEMIATAKNPVDIEYIKNCVNRGEFPSMLPSAQFLNSDPLPPPPLPQTDEKENGLTSLTGKRKLSTLDLPSDVPEHKYMRDENV